MRAIIGDKLTTRNVPQSFGREFTRDDRDIALTRPFQASERRRRGGGRGERTQEKGCLHFEVAQPHPDSGRDVHDDASLGEDEDDGQLEDHGDEHGAAEGAVE